MLQSRQLARWPWRRISTSAPIQYRAFHKTLHALEDIITKTAEPLPDTRTQGTTVSHRPLKELLDSRNRLASQDSLDSLGYSAGERYLLLKLDSSSPPKRFDYTWLRDGCRCPRCVDGSTKQRDFNMPEIPHNIKADSVKWDGEQLEITWANDMDGYTDHITTYSREYLTDAKLEPDGVNHNRFRYLWGKANMEEMQYWIGFEDYINDDAKFAFAMRQLSIFGLVFVKDVPDSREMVEKIATRMGPLRNTFYGQTWDVRSVPEAKNVAYTDKVLDFHMDLLYMNEPPGYQLLHCLQNSCDGGESLFADTFNIASFIRRKFPRHAENLARTVLSYEYSHDHAHYKNSWPVFNYRKSSGRGHHLHNVNYSPPFQAHAHPSSFAWMNASSSDQNPMASLNHFAKLLKNDVNIFEMKMQPGQCVIFENRRVVHSRRQFNSSSGRRWLAGAYVDEDDLRSQFWKCATSQPEAWQSSGEHVRSIAQSFKLARNGNVQPEQQREVDGVL